MALYRCAACGSPRVMRDTQFGGYSYSKGLFGSLLFGSGGASAGINGKMQSVYRCPDCGVTLTYSMSPTILAKIERGLIDPTFPRLDWAALKAQYKNLEDGVIDRKLQRESNSKANAVARISPISKDEFIETAKNIADYMAKCGYFGKGSRIYDVIHLPSAEVYLNVCKDVKIFIDHMPQFMSLFDMQTSKSSSNYEKLFNWVEIGRLMLFVMVLEYYEKTGKPMPTNFDVAEDFFRRNMHLKDLGLKCNLITSLLSDPSSICFGNTIASSMCSDDEIDWLSISYGELCELFYPRIIVKGNHVEINHLNI